MSDRDYAAEMRAVIDEATSHGPYSSPRIATEIVEKLRANDPALLSGWLDEQAEHFVRIAINQRDSSLRTVRRRKTEVADFEEAAEAHRHGEVAPLRRYLDAPYTLEDGNRKPLAQLTKDDLLYVAGTYEARAAENSLRAVFMHALAKKVRRGAVVSDHFTEAQIAGMFDSIAA